MFTSKEWKSMDFSMLGKLVEDVVLNKEFWKNVMICYKSIHHLLFALGLVNLINEPAMGFIYEHMEKAKEEIRTNLSEGGVEKESFMLTQKIIDECWDKKGYSPLHAAGYFLNPQFHYSPGYRDDIKVKRGLQHCITRMVADPEERSKIEIQLDDFDKGVNDFSHPIAAIASAEEIPAIWWASFANGQPELQKFAIRVLSLTSSSYGGPHLQRAFQTAHANTLSQKAPSDVLFVMANSELGIKKKASVEINHDDNGTVEGLDVDALDLDKPCLKPQDDVGIADLHDENANGDGNEDDDEDGDEN